MRTLFTLFLAVVFSTTLVAQFENTTNDPQNEARKALLVEKDQQLLKQSQLKQAGLYKTSNVVFRLDSMLEEEYSSNDQMWEADDLEHIFYSADYMCTAELDFDFSSTGRDSSALSWYTYDANGNFTQDLSAYYYATGWDTSWKEVMTYDAMNRYTGMTDYNYTNGQWEINWKSEYTYDANGHILLEERFDWTNNTWELYYKKDFYIHSDGRMGSTVSFYMSSSTLLKDDSVYYHYNMSNLEVERTRYNWTYGQWELDHRYLYAYDANNHLAARTSMYYYTSSGWDTSYRYVYNHNAQGYLLDEIEQDWSNGQWENYYKEVYTYNMNFVYPQIAANPYYLDDIDVMFLTGYGYEWDDNTSAWIGEYRETLYWTSTNIGIAEVETQAINVYPNPATEAIYIELAADTETRIKLYNLSGQQLMTKTLNDQHNSIDVSRYMPGLYVLVFETNGNIAFKKVLLY